MYKIFTLQIAAQEKNTISLTSSIFIATFERKIYFE